MGRGLQHVTGFFAAHVLVRQPVKFVINQRQEPVERRLVTCIPILQKLSYFAGGDHG